ATSQERREADIARKRRKKAAKTPEQHQYRRQEEANASRQQQAIKSYHPIPHHATANKYINCSYCNALKLPSEALECAVQIENGLNSALIQSLKTMLDKVNLYIINQRYILRLPTENIANLAMLIHIDIPGIDLRTFNILAASQIAAIWVDNEIPSDMIQNPPNNEEDATELKNSNEAPANNNILQLKIIMQLTIMLVQNGIEN
ncbi:2144_t:CDS:2, partial [Gigaspora rosea]